MSNEMTYEILMSKGELARWMKEKAFFEPQNNEYLILAAANGNMAALAELGRRSGVPDNRALLVWLLKLRGFSGDEIHAAAHRIELLMEHLNKDLIPVISMKDEVGDALTKLTNTIAEILVATAPEYNTSKTAGIRIGPKHVIVKYAAGINSWYVGYTGDHYPFRRESKEEIIRPTEFLIRMAVTDEMKRMMWKEGKSLEDAFQEISAKLQKEIEKPI